MLWGGCDQLVTPRALGPLHDIGRQTGGDPRGSAHRRRDPGADLRRLSRRARTGPVRRRHVVVVEDVHWADEATLDWLAFLVGGWTAAALLVLTYRDDEVGAEHPLRRVLASLPAAVSQRVPVAALSEDCVLRQARLAGGTPTRSIDWPVATRCWSPSCSRPTPRWSRPRCRT